MRNVFVSYSHRLDQDVVDEFRRKFGNDKMVFSDRSLENKDLSYLSDDTIKNNYIRPQLRWDMYVELITRITTQPLDDATGDEETALNSVYQLFPITRDILKSKGRNAENFTKIAVIVLNQIIRPFTAKWHKKKLSGEFSNENECIQFRTELKQLQADLICYSRLLADMAKVEDLTCLLEEDE